MDPYDPYAHIKEFQKMHHFGQDSTPTNYNHGLNDDDLEIQRNHGYFTRDQMHYFSIFVNYRFLYSHRQKLTDNDFWDYFIKDLWERDRVRKLRLLAELQKYQRFDSKQFALHQELLKEQSVLEQQQKRIMRNLGRQQTLYFNVPSEVAQNLKTKKDVNKEILPPASRGRYGSRGGEKERSPLKKYVEN